MSRLFGPVTSRRYGKSLGVDLIPMKTCTLSCRFCQLGVTPSTGLTTSRITNPDIAEVLAELKAFFTNEHEPVDFVTASGSGEPTLHQHFGDVLRFVKSETDVKSLLLSNGSLLWMEDVRKDAIFADVAKVSLSSWNQESFASLLRPSPELDFEKMVNGYRNFREIYEGQLDCEVFLVPGYNDTVEACEKIAAIIETFSPNSVSVNTAIRPGADVSVKPVPENKLESLRRIFGTRAKSAGGEIRKIAVTPTKEAITALVCRHPVSEEVLCSSTGLTPEELAKLLSGDELSRDMTSGKAFWRVRD